MMLGIVILGAIKIITMICILFQWHSDPRHYLRTIGDAVVSFIEMPDPTTEGMCLVTKSQLRRKGWEKEFGPRVYEVRRARWMDCMSRSRFWSIHGL
jgi:hypothetical protein